MKAYGFVLVALFVFCVLDCVTTLLAIGAGGVELNPLMAALLNVGSFAFVALKLGVTSLAVALLYSARVLLSGFALGSRYRFGCGALLSCATVALAADMAYVVATNLVVLLFFC